LALLMKWRCRNLNPLASGLQKEKIHDRRIETINPGR
jgi:hypothetical protein